MVFAYKKENKNYEKYDRRAGPFFLTGSFGL